MIALAILPMTGFERFVVLRSRILKWLIRPIDEVTLAWPKRCWNRTKSPSHWPNSVRWATAPGRNIMLTSRSKLDARRFLARCGRLVVRWFSSCYYRLDRVLFRL